MSFNKQPNLIDDGFISNIGNKIKSQNLSTETNMMVERFANKDKLVDEDQIMYFDRDNDNDDMADLDDNVDKYKKTSQNTSKPDIFKSTPGNKESDKKQSEKKQGTQSSETATSTKEKEYDPDDESQWSDDEMWIRKMDMLRKLGELVDNGVKLSQDYNMDSNYKTMKFEHDLHTGIRSKRNTVNWMSGMMIGIVKGMEMLNDNYNPFDIKFENTWSNNVTTNINEYYDVLGEIYEKYTTPGKKMPPELKLFLLLSGSAISIQMHKGIKNLIPTTSQDINNDPELVQNLREQADNRQNEQQKVKHQLDEKLNKDHAIASAKVADFTKINNYKKEYDILQQRAQNSETNRFANGLILSDQPIQRGHNTKKETETTQNQQLHQQQLYQQQEKQRVEHMFAQKQKEEILAQNQKLIAMQQMLRDMKTEEKIVETTKKHSSGRKEQSQESTKSKHNSTHDSETRSKSSSKSSYSVNPNLEKILGQQYDESSHGSSRSSKKSAIVLNIDDDLHNLSLESSDNSIKIVNKHDDDMDIGMISFGKKSNNSGKRGRPAKSKSDLKIKIGK